MDIQEYINEYANWLKSEITFTQIGEYYEINTPFLDTDNDYLQFYVKQDGNELFFTDDGFTLTTLESYGFKLTKSRKQQLIGVLNQYGVKLKDKELTIKSSLKEFPPKKHAFTQCLVRVSDLHMISRAKVTSYFLDDIQEFRLCFAINNPTRTSMGNALFAWEDTRPERRNDRQLIIFLNDSNSVAKGIEDGFTNYNVNTIRWSERTSKDNIKLLSA